MSDETPKSAVEITMERLRQKDLQNGVEHSPLTDQQKAAIAEVRNLYEAKLAQEEVMHQSALARTFDQEARTILQDEYRRSRERLVSERDAKVDRVRCGAPDA